VLDAIVAEARSRGLDGAVEDGLAAATLMAMNNVYYRFRDMVGKPAYSEKPARLRMGRLAQPATSRTDLELFSLAASAINGCEACVRAHEDMVVKGGLAEEAVHDAVRIAAVIHAAAVGLEIGKVRAPNLAVAGDVA
jgi:lipoyl-dependent peroxiredoxin subunit D